MRGVFRFYQDGVLVAEVPNLITTAGKVLITQYLAGQATSLGEAIALGVSPKTVTVGDTRLDFEISRIQVDVKTADTANNVVVFKGTLTQGDIYNIYEMGLWSAFSDVIAREFNSRILTIFDLTTEPWTNVVSDTTGTRIGSASAKVTVPLNTTVSTRNASVQMDLSGYSGNDQVKVAIYKPDNNILGVTIAFEDQTTGGSLKSPEQLTAALPIGYNILTVNKSAFTQTGTISWASINRYGLDVRAGTASTLNVDSIRLEDTDTINRDYILVSHAVLGSPLVKTNAAPMDVEYALDFTVA